MTTNKALAMRNHALHQTMDSQQEWLDRHRVVLAKLKKETIRWGAVLPEGYLLRVRDILAEVI